MKNNKFLTAILSVGLSLILAFGAAACGDSSSSGSGSGSTGSSPAKPAKPVKIDAVNVDETVRANLDGITDADIQAILDGDKNFFALAFKGVTVGDAFVEFVNELDKAIKNGEIDGDISADDSASSGDSQDGMPDTLSALVPMLKCGYYDYNGTKKWCLERVSTDGETVVVTDFSDAFTNALFKYSLSSVGNDKENIPLTNYYLKNIAATKMAFDSVMANFIGGAVKSDVLVKSFKEKYPAVDPTVLDWAAKLTAKDVYDFSCGNFSCAGDITFGQVIKFFKDVENAAKAGGDTPAELDAYDLTSLYTELDKLIGNVKLAEFKTELKKISLYSAVDAVATVAVSSFNAAQADADAFKAYLKDVYDSSSTMGTLKIKDGKTVDFKQIADLFKKLVPEVKNDKKAAA